MRSAIIKKASQDEQQNQTTTTTNINYIQNLCPFKKINNKVRIESDTTETKQNNLNFTKKYTGPDHNEAR